jgi:hypothetical protein
MLICRVNAPTLICSPASMNRPRSGSGRTRAAYHYAVRRVKRDERDTARQQFADSTGTNSSRDCWLEVKTDEWEGW